MKVDGPKLRRLRETRLALSVDEASKEAGVAPPTWLRAEHGEEIRVSSVRRIADALGVSPADLAPTEVGEFPKDQPSLFVDTEQRRSPSYPDVPTEAFLMTVKSATPEQLRTWIKELVGNQEPETIEDLRRAREGDQEARFRRIGAFARAMIIREELIARGDQAPEEYLPDLKRHLDALDF